MRGDSNHFTAVAFDEKIHKQTLYMQRTRQTKTLAALARSREQARYRGIATIAAAQHCLPHVGNFRGAVAVPLGFSSRQQP
jgi:hypothetical protein